MAKESVDYTSISSSVKLYDSAMSNSISSAVQMSIANILHSPEQTITVHFMNSDVQKNGNDCGVYAIANDVELCCSVGFQKISHLTLEQ